MKEVCVCVCVCGLQRHVLLLPQLFQLLLKALDLVPELLLEEPVGLLCQVPLPLRLFGSGFQPDERVVK